MDYKGLLTGFVIIMEKNKEMKVLLLIDGLESGGAQRQIVYLANILVENGCQVKIIQYLEETFFLNDLNEHIEVRTIFSKSYLGRILRIRREIRKGWQDFLISFLETPNFIANFASIGRRTWSIITSERAAVEQSFYGLKKKIYKHFERYSDFLVCNSYAARDLWLKYYPKYNKKIKVIHNMVPILEHKDRVLTVQSSNLKKTKIIVAARVNEDKNPRGLLTALSIMRPEDREKLIIEWYGRFDGKVQSFKKEIGDLLLKFNLTDVVKFLPETNKIIEIMSGADIIGLFSRFEDLPNAILEGVSLSKPIIMSRVSDYKYLVNDRNGFTFEWDNPIQIAGVLERVSKMTEADILERGKESKKIADNLFSPDAFAEKWLNLLKACEPIKYKKR